MEEWDIQYKELLSMPEQSYRLIDIRDEASMSYGMIPGAEWLPTETIEQNLDAADKEKKLVLYCTRGALSEECAEVLREKGYDAVSLEGGYTRWLLERMEAEQKKEEEESGEELLRAEEIEKSIRKKFHKRLFSRFAKAVREYELVQEGDRIAVCISGGKDSMLLAKLFQELYRHGKRNFETIPYSFYTLHTSFAPYECIPEFHTQLPLLYLQALQDFDSPFRCIPDIFPSLRYSRLYLRSLHL